MPRVRPTDLLEARQVVSLRAARKAAAARNMKPPDTAALSYDRELTRVFKGFQELALSKLEPELFRIAAPTETGATRQPDRPDAMVPSLAFRSDAFLPSQLEAVFRDIGRLVDAFLESVGIQGILDTQFTRVNNFTMRELGRSMGVDISNVKNGVGALLEQFRTENILLIRRALQGSLQDLSDSLAAAQGERVETIRDEIQTRFGVSRSRAALIARDQTLKLNAQVNQQRQTELGVTQYKWVTSHDSRVRDGHELLDQKIFSWVLPPIVEPPTPVNADGSQSGAGRRAHPGQDFQCRCTATPILDNIF